MSEHTPDTPHGYLLDAIHKGIRNSQAYLTSLRSLTPQYSSATPHLKPAPDGSYIISQPRRNNSSQPTNFIISPADEHTYALLTTLDGPVKVKLQTTITIAGSHHQQIVQLNLNPHSRSILGRAYCSLFQNNLTQAIQPNIPLPQFHETKGLTGRRMDKISWAVVLLQDPDTLSAYEDIVRSTSQEDLQDHPDHQGGTPASLPGAQTTRTTPPNPPTTGSAPRVNQPPPPSTNAQQTVVEITPPAQDPQDTAGQGQNDESNPLPGGTSAQTPLPPNPGTSTPLPNPPGQDVNMTEDEELLFEEDLAQDLELPEATTSVSGSKAFRNDPAGDEATSHQKKKKTKKGKK
jgi:hypothetical protein